jgi:hypothetical protein
MEDRNQGTARDILQSLRIIYLAMVAGAIFFYLLSFIMVHFRGPLNPLDKVATQALFMGCLIADVILVPTAYLLHIRKLKQIKLPRLAEKMGLYRTSIVLKLSILEAISYMGMVVYLIIGYFPILAATAIVILLIILNRPTVTLIASELGLSEAEISQLQD